MKAQLWRRRSSRDSLPTFCSWQFFLTTFTMGLALFILRLEIQHLWPTSPQWVRAGLSFLVAALVGEFWVVRYWSTLRISAAQAWEVVGGYGLIALLVTLLTLALEMQWGIQVWVELLAGVSYLSLLLLDISYRW